MYISALALARSSHSRLVSARCNRGVCSSPRIGACLVHASRAKSSPELDRWSWNGGDQAASGQEPRFARGVTHVRSRPAASPAQATQRHSAHYAHYGTARRTRVAHSRLRRRDRCAMRHAPAATSPVQPWTARQACLRSSDQATERHAGEWRAASGRVSVSRPQL